jgi:hypothetical protein
MPLRSTSARSRKEIDMSELKRGTVGFLDGHYSFIVEHVFTDGRLLLRDMSMKRSYAVTDPTSFTPSRDAYCCIGSFVEPQWEADSCRCLNYWAEEKHNQPENIWTDAEAWEFFNRMTA